MNCGRKIGGPRPALVVFRTQDFLCRHFAGNHVVIPPRRTVNLVVTRSLIKGPDPAESEDKVRAGDELGRCGHTGHSSEPHLHFHLQ